MDQPLDIQHKLERHLKIGENHGISKLNAKAPRLPNTFNRHRVAVQKQESKENMFISWVFS